MGSAILGAAITAVAGLLGAFALRWLDIQRENRGRKDEFQAALRVVSDEPEGNIQTARLVVNEGAKVPPAFGPTTYHERQTVLALNLGPGDRLKLAKADEPIRVPQALGKMVSTLSFTDETIYYFEPNMVNMKSALQKMEEAKQLIDSRIDDDSKAKN